MRCSTTASLRATATRARAMPRRRATFRPRPCGSTEPWSASAANAGDLRPGLRPEGKLGAARAAILQPADIGLPVIPDDELGRRPLEAASTPHFMRAADRNDRLTTI